MTSRPSTRIGRDDAVAQRDVQHRPVFGDVDPLAGEHAIAQRLDAAHARELGQQAQRVGGDEVLRDSPPADRRRAAEKRSKRRGSLWNHSRRWPRRIALRCDSRPCQTSNSVSSLTLVSLLLLPWRGHDAAQEPLRAGPRRHRLGRARRRAVARARGRHEAAGGRLHQADSHADRPAHLLHDRRRDRPHARGQGRGADRPEGAALFRGRLDAGARDRARRGQRAQPGLGVTLARAETRTAADYANPAAAQSTVEFILNIIPDTMVGAFARGDLLQVLVVSVLFGLALLALGDSARRPSSRSSISSRRCSSRS